MRARLYFGCTRWDRRRRLLHQYGARGGLGSAGTSSIRRRSTIRPTSPSRSTTPTSRSCATCATCSCRAALRSQLHGHRRDRQSRDRAFPFADRAARVERPRAELRVRPARAGQAAAQVRRPRRDAGAHAPRTGTTREEEVKARLLSYNNAPVWQIGGEIVTGMHADHIRFPELPGNLYHAPDADLDARQHRRRAASRRSVVSRAASCRGTPTTC